jgi:hypothetical protein
LIDFSTVAAISDENCSRSVFFKLEFVFEQFK